MKRLYYLTDSLSSVIGISKDLSSAGIGENRLHVMGSNRGELDQAHVHTTTPWEETDIMHYGFMGAMIGIVAGLVVGAALMAMEPFGIELGYEVVIATTAFLTCLGAWFGGIVGIQHRNHHLQPYLDRIGEGQFLVVVDADSDVQENKVRKVLTGRHREAREAGHEDHYSPFF